MGAVYFKISDIAPLIDEALSAARRMPGAGDYAAGRVPPTPVPAEGFEEMLELPDECSNAIPPRVLLVQDLSVYLMSNAAHTEAGSGQGRRVVWAEGLDPRTNEAWWRDARHLVGDDDFTEPFEISELAGLLESRPDGYLKVSLAENGFRIEAVEQAA